ncbi:hypothetical protein [Alkaliphilus pronyensis]|uniref:hypothetical protein n=1 Tax=Alkaliphilus pronyensis TaxID=1482732 RepID=UPI0018657088|nr:hypothetical protein [Alkaliphilus pronyensis]
MNKQVKTLKDLLKTYGDQKSDTEISQMLGISIDKVKSERSKINKDSFRDLLKINHNK